LLADFGQVRRYLDYSYYIDSRLSTVNGQEVG
jgi:hypothetical protein